jgi:hypothetical protein
VKRGAISGSTHAKIFAKRSQGGIGCGTVGAAWFRDSSGRLSSGDKNAVSMEIALQWTDFITLSRVLAALADSGIKLNAKTA